MPSDSAEPETNKSQGSLEPDDHTRTFVSPQEGDGTIDHQYRAYFDTHEYNSTYHTDGLHVVTSAVTQS